MHQSALNRLVLARFALESDPALPVTLAILKVQDTHVHSCLAPFLAGLEHNGRDSREDDDRRSDRKTSQQLVR